MTDEIKKNPITEAFIDELLQFMLRRVKSHPRYRLPSINARDLDVLIKKVYKYTEVINDKH